MSFAQGGASQKKLAKMLTPMMSALSTIIESQWVDSGSKKRMKSFLQSAAAAKEAEDDDLSLAQPQAKMVAYESSSGGIVSTLEEMQGKAEDTLSSLRKKEMTAAHGYDMMKSGLEDELKNEKEKLTWSIAEKAK